jgi:DNA-binding beta-propeller fold protein YncE
MERTRTCSLAAPLLAAALAVSLASGCAHQRDQKYDLVIPPPPETARYRLEWIYQGSDDYQTGGVTSDLLFGKQSAAETHRLFKPIGVVSDGKGLVYVTDTARPPRVEVFDDVKREVRMIGTEGQGQLLLPLGLALGPDGTIYVADALRKQVVAFAPDGAVRAAYGSKETLGRPTATAVDGERGLLYVADTSAHRVQVFSLAGGALLRTIGRRGSGPGEFNFPEALTVAPDGSLYVVDTMNFRYQVFDQEGKFLVAHGSIGQEPGRFARPKSIALDQDGHVYVSDAAFSNVQVFDAEGRLLIWIGGGGSIPGAFALAEGVFVDANDRVFVVDQQNRRVQRFHYLRETGAGPATPAPTPSQAQTKGSAEEGGGHR